MTSIMIPPVMLTHGKEPIVCMCSILKKNLEIEHET